jgi:hypothetical protein
MKAYVITTGAVFGLLVMTHIWRVVEEGPALAKNPSCLVITIAAAALCLGGPAPTQAHGALMTLAVQPHNDSLHQSGRSFFKSYFVVDVVYNRCARSTPTLGSPRNMPST